ncbi:MAG TPA: 2Fe-2S iron-sulfur cluster-binding protein [Myxococcales bacterium]|nr:2Fe-2S iron-sulfur cluster-binding protein [Myxococcales bacterium]
MPKVTFLPDGITAEVPRGTSILDAGMAAGVRIGNACGGVCACSTCHVWVKQGFGSLSEQDDRELDILDKAFDVKPTSRLSCQAEVGDADLVVEVTPESQKTFYDEHPEERRKLEAAQGGPAR